MYSNFLFIHSWVRWLVVLLTILVLFKYSYSLVFKKSYSLIDRVLASSLLGTVHLQFILGIILYFGLSPIVADGLHNMKAMMKDPVHRYWAIEHLVAMVTFLILIQLGFSFSKRAIEGVRKHKIMLVYTGISFLILMGSMPWPIRAFGRPLFHF